jgi:hypothetical protein
LNGSEIPLRDYDGEVCQIIMRDNGCEKPTFIITNDQEAPAAHGPKRMKY